MKNKNNGKILTIFLCIVIALLFCLAITFTLVKNNLNERAENLNNKNQEIVDML